MGKFDKMFDMVGCDSHLGCCYYISSMWEQKLNVFSCCCSTEVNPVTPESQYVVGLATEASITMMIDRCKGKVQSD